MFENGHIYYFPFAMKMLIALLVLALPWDKWLSFLPSFIKKGFVSYRQFLAPVAQDEAHKWYFFLTRLTLSLIIFLLPIAYDFYVPEVAGDLRWYMMHSVGLALCVLFFIYQIERYKTQRTMQLSIQLPFTSWMVIITVLFGFLTLTWGESLPSNWWFLKHLMGYALIFAFALQARHLQWYNNLFWLLAASVSFNAILGIMQFFALTDADIIGAFPFMQSLAETFPSLQSWRILGFFQQSAPPAGAFANKNLAASFMVMTIPLMAYLMLNSKNNLKLVLSTTALTLACVFLLYTRSRGSWVSACTALAFAAIWLCLHKPLRSALIEKVTLKKGVAFLISIAILLWSASFQSGFAKKGQQFHSMSTTVTEQFSSIKDIEKGELATRIAYNINGVDILKDHPFGIGLGGFHTIYPAYFKSSMVTPKPGYNLQARPRRMHNDMFQMFIELGVIGGLAHLLIFLSPIFMAWRIQKNEAAPNNAKMLSFFALVGIGGMCVNSLGDFPLQMPTAPGVLWLLVGVVTGLYLQHANKPKVYGFNLKAKLNPQILFGTLMALSAILLTFISYDNYQRREGTLYLKPALGMTRASQHSDMSVYFINRSMEEYPLNPRAREIWGVVYMSYKNGISGKRYNITSEDIEHKLLEAIRFDPYAQNNLVNLAMTHIRKTQKFMQEKNMTKANQHIQQAIMFAERAAKVSYYAPNAPTVYGLALLYVGENQEAYNQFKEALKRNPDYLVAKEYIQKLQPLIQAGKVKP